PALLGTMILLFGNAFGAYATAFALTGGALNLVPIQIGAQIRGDVLHNPNLGYALALGMVVIMAVALAGGTPPPQRRAPGAGCGPAGSCFSSFPGFTARPLFGGAPAARRSAWTLTARCWPTRASAKRSPIRPGWPWRPSPPAWS